MVPAAGARAGLDWAVPVRAARRPQAAVEAMESESKSPAALVMVLGSEEKATAAPDCPS